jgi:hypothetical protein
MKHKTLSFVPMSKVVALFHKGIHEQIWESITDSNVSFGYDKQSTFISRDTFIDLVDGLFDGDDATAEQGYTLNDALNEGIAKVKMQVGKNIFLMIEG